MGDFFFLIGFWGVLGLPYCCIGATIRIGGEVFCPLYAGFYFFIIIFLFNFSAKFLIGVKEPRGEGQGIFDNVQIKADFFLGIASITHRPVSKNLPKHKDDG